MELNKSLTKKRALELIDNKLEEFRVLSYEVSTSDNTMKITADSMASKDKRSDQYIEERGKRAFDEYQRLEANYKALYSSTIALIARITPQDGVSYFESKEREYRTHREEYANKPPEKKRHWTLGLLMGVGSVALSVLEALLTTGQSALTSNITPVVKALEEYKALIVNAVPDDREYSQTEIVIGDISNVWGKIQIQVGEYNRIVESLDNTNQAELAHALQVLVTAVLASKNLSQDDKEDYLTVINQIGAEASKPYPNKRILAKLGKGLVADLQEIPDVAKAVISVAPILAQLHLREYIPKTDTI